MEVKEVILPDGEKLTEARRNAINSGYDHYWRFHEDEEEWAKLGCPICKAKHSTEKN